VVDSKLFVRVEIVVVENIQKKTDYSNRPNQFQNRASAL